MPKQLTLRRRLLFNVPQGLSELSELRCRTNIEVLAPSGSLFGCATWDPGGLKHGRRVGVVPREQHRGTLVDHDKINVELIHLGADGWELVSALRITEVSGVSTRLVMSLKRPAE